MTTVVMNQKAANAPRFPWRLVQGFILNVLFLAFQWSVIAHLDRKGHAVAEVLVFIAFIGTIGLSLKLWFYTLVAMTLSRAMNE